MADPVAQRCTPHHRIDRRPKRKCHLKPVAIWQLAENPFRCAFDLPTTKLAVGFDSGMIVLAMSVLNVFHSNRLLTDDVVIMRLGGVADIEMLGKVI